MTREQAARMSVRRYYQDRIVGSYRYSGALTSVTGMPPLAACRTRAFEEIVDRGIVGSPSTAREVSTLVRQELAAGDWSQIPWAGDLLAYESAVFELAATEPAPSQPVQVELRHDVLSILPELLMSPDVPPDAPPGACTVLVGAGQEGSLSVRKLQPARN